MYTHSDPLQFSELPIEDMIDHVQIEILMAQLGNHRGFKADPERILGQWVSKLQDISDNLA